MATKYTPTTPVSKLYQEQVAPKTTTPATTTPSARVKDTGTAPASTFTYGLGSPAVTQITKPGQTLPTTTAKTPTPTAKKPSTAVTPSPATTTPEDVILNLPRVPSEQPQGKTTVRTEYIGSGKSRVLRTYFSDGTFSDSASPEEEQVVTALGTTNVQVIKSILRAAGYPASLIDSSVSFLTTLSQEGLDEDSIVDIFLNNSTYTTRTGSVLTSPFYSAYGKFNEGLSIPYTPSQLFNTVEGYRNAQTKFNLNDKFVSDDYIKQYLKNRVSVAKFEENINQARLKSLTADPNVVGTLRDLGYINTSQDLTDFYLDPKIGIEQMQQNINTAALSVEARRRANLGISLDAEVQKKLGAYLTSQGMSEATISALASKAYQTIGEQLRPLTALEGIYGGPDVAKEDVLQKTIQQELEQEQLMGLESQRRKMRTEQNIRAFQAAPGTTAISLSSGILPGTL